MSHNTVDNISKMLSFLSCKVIYGQLVYFAAMNSML